VLSRVLSRPCLFEEEVRVGDRPDDFVADAMPDVAVLGRRRSRGRSRDHEARPPRGHDREQAPDLPVEVLEGRRVRGAGVSVLCDGAVEVEPVGLVERRDVDELEEQPVLGQPGDGLLDLVDLVLERIAGRDPEVRDQWLSANSPAGPFRAGSPGLKNPTPRRRPCGSRPMPVP